jgi:antitoxin (DNA-binding transcriptional repressor) of toxin-antitoxin stability system
MARTIRKSGVKEVLWSEVKDDLSHLLREAAKQDIVITRHGKPAGVLMASNRKMIGSKTIPGSCDALKARGQACARGAASGCKV